MKKLTYYTRVVEESYRKTDPLTGVEMTIVTGSVGDVRGYTKDDPIPTSEWRLSTPADIEAFRAKRSAWQVEYETRVAAVPDLPGAFYAVSAEQGKFTSLGLKATIQPNGKYAVVTVGYGVSLKDVTEDALKSLFANVGDPQMRFATEEESIRIQSRLDKETK